MMKVLLLWYQFWQIFHTIICRFLSTFENSHGQRFSNRMGSLPFCIMTMSISTPFWILILSFSNPNPGWIVAQWRKIQCWKMTLSWTSHSPSFFPYLMYTSTNSLRRSSPSFAYSFSLYLSHFLTSFVMTVFSTKEIPLGSLWFKLSLFGLIGTIRLYFKTWAYHASL